MAVGGTAFVLFAAPMVLSGEATIAGYIKLDDTATWLALTDRVLDQGPNAAGLSASTYEATLAVNFENGYPFGGFVPLGGVARILGVDLAWAFQPYLALIGALLALALWQLGGALVRSRPLRIVSAVGASQAALFVGFYLWGGVKELAVAMLVATACALAADGAGRPGWRPLLAPIAAGAAVVPFASPAGLVWLVPVAVGVLFSRLRHGARPVAVAIGTAAVAAAVAAVVSPAGNSVLVAARIRTRTISATSRAPWIRSRRWASGPPRISASILPRRRLRRWRSASWWSAWSVARSRSCAPGRWRWVPTASARSAWPQRSGSSRRRGSTQRLSPSRRRPRCSWPCSAFRA